MKQIPLTQGKVALVDDEDYNRLKRYKWFACYSHRWKRWYACRNSSRLLYQNGKTKKLLYMQHFICNVPEGTRINFKDSNPLNLQKNNIRFATLSQSQHSQRKHASHKTSEYKGVSWHKKKNNWRAYIKDTYLGSFPNEIDAAKAYDNAAIKLFGEFANINFPKKHTTIA